MVGACVGRPLRAPAPCSGSPEPVARVGEGPVLVTMCAASHAGENPRALAQWRLRM